MGMEIVESPTSFTVDTEKGSVKIARNSWIVLEPLYQPSSEGGFAGRGLAEALGGGTISEKGRVDLLRLVPPDRLHATSAEANFKRAGRGTSLLTLRHAAYAMEMLSQREREVETGAMSVPLQSCLSQATPLDRTLLDRLHRVSRMVKDAACAAKSRTPVPFNYQRPRASLLMPEVTRPTDRLLRGNAQLHKGVRCLEEFHEFVVRRFGNSVRAW